MVIATADLVADQELSYLLGVIPDGCKHKGVSMTMHTATQRSPSTARGPMTASSTANHHGTTTLVSLKLLLLRKPGAQIG